MESLPIKAPDFIDERKPVIEAATRIAGLAAAHLRSGGCVVILMHGVRGASSSFFNVILSAVAEALQDDFSEGRFRVETDTPTQQAVYERSLDAFAKRRGKSA